MLQIKAFVFSRKL